MGGTYETNKAHHRGQGYGALHPRKPIQSESRVMDDGFWRVWWLLGRHLDKVLVRGFRVIVWADKGGGVEGLRGEGLRCWTTMFLEESSCLRARDHADRKALDPEYVASNYPSTHDSLTDIQSKQRSGKGAGKVGTGVGVYPAKLPTLIINLFFFLHTQSALHTQTNEHTYRVRYKGQTDPRPRSRDPRGGGDTCHST